MEEKQSLKDKAFGFYRKCVRVWHILRKPTREEFLTVAKVSAIGIGIIGLIGFIILLLMRLIA
jgi:protein transport protein SEC61 subunit gamma-like protein